MLTVYQILILFLCYFISKCFGSYELRLETSDNQNF